MAKISILDDVVLDSSNVAASTESEYNSSTTYAIDAIVKVSYESDGTTPRTPVKEYKSLAGSNTGNYPPDSPTQWIDQGASNKWAMFDYLGTSQTTADAADNDIIVEVDGSDADMIALFNLDNASQVEIIQYDESTSSRTQVDSVTIPLSLRETTTYTEYFFGRFIYRDQYVWYPTAYSNATFKVTITATTGSQAKCGQCIVGQSYGVGDTKWGASVEIHDFSVRDTDDFGNTILTQRDWVKKLNCRMIMDANTYDTIYRSYIAVRATPLLIDANANNTDYDSLRFYGFVRNFKPSIKLPKANRNEYRLEARGLI